MQSSGENYRYWARDIVWSRALPASPEASFETFLAAGISTFRVSAGESVVFLYQSTTAEFNFAWNGAVYRELIAQHALDAPSFAAADGSRFRYRVNRRTGLVKGAFYDRASPSIAIPFTGVVLSGRNQIAGLVPVGTDPGSFDIRPSTVNW